MKKHTQHIEAEDFLNIIKQDCDRAGVKYLFPETNKVDYPGTGNIQASGYFDDKIGPTLACAIGKPEKDWYEVLVHESCHMDQWIEKDPLWLAQFENGVDCDKGMDDWLAGKEFHVDEYTHYIRTMQALEIDCEKRSVKKIIELGLDIDTKGYTQRANSYLYFYTVMLHTQKWSDVSPYEIPEIVNLMPDYFLENDEYLSVSNDLLKLYDRCYNK